MYYNYKGELIDRDEFDKTLDNLVNVSCLIGVIKHSCEFKTYTDEAMALKIADDMLYKNIGHLNELI